MCFRSGSGRGVEISADRARNVLLLPDRLSETRSARSSKVTIPARLQRNDDLSEVDQSKLESWRPSLSATRIRLAHLGYLGRNAFTKHMSPCGTSRRSPD